ncbi:hypothetical protein NDU88_004280 [Pleurodeles waltl]|uniref:Uncharacterized protein n=1 Tax=Pleurodeles waltl TaxID=8319 RepID=A0AAV7LQG7_PLEWA|nr:hypothetical protein NDU88_004280 [Pleurodeles waltl]
MIKRQEGCEPVLLLWYSMGSLVNSKMAINDAFRAHLSTAYVAQGDVTGGHGTGFLARINLPCLSETHRTSLEGPITWEEILAAMKKLNTAKSPGSDGLPAEFYQKYKTPVMDRLLEYQEDIRGVWTTPPTGRSRF